MNPNFRTPITPSRATTPNFLRKGGEKDRDPGRDGREEHAAYTGDEYFYINFPAGVCGEIKITSVSANENFTRNIFGSAPRRAASSVLRVFEFRRSRLSELALHTRMFRLETRYRGSLKDYWHPLSIGSVASRDDTYAFHLPVTN